MDKICRDRHKYQQSEGSVVLKVIGKNVEQQKCRNDIFSFFCDQGKNVESEKILQLDIFVVKFKKGKNVELQN